MSRWETINASREHPVRFGCAPGKSRNRGETSEYGLCARDRSERATGKRERGQRKLKGNEIKNQGLKKKVEREGARQSGMERKVEKRGKVFDRKSMKRV